jgi:hypothetical protein
MRVKIQSCTRELREDNGEKYTGVKINGQWYNWKGDHRDKYNKEVDVEIKGKWVEEPGAQQAMASAATSNGNSQKMDWTVYASFMRDAHKLALELEPDILANADKPEEIPVVIADRAAARHAILATAMIALGKGNFEYGDDIPF